MLILRSFPHCLTGATILESIDDIRVYNLSVFDEFLIVVIRFRIGGGCAMFLFPIVVLIEFLICK